MAIVLDGSTGIANDGGYTGDGVVFADTTPANTLVTTTGGNVGIGTSSPASKLHTYAASGNASNRIESGSASSVAVSTIYKTANRTWEIGQAPGIGDNSFTIYDATAAAVRAAIDSSGNLLVGATGSAGSFKIQVYSANLATTTNGVLVTNGANSTGGYFHAFQNYVGTIIGAISQATSTTVSYVTSSDYRLKDNISPMTGALATVAQLKPCTYTWKLDNSAGQGFIAHELAEVCPEAVVGEKDGVDAEGKPKYQGIDTSFLVATLTAAIQEQQAIITEQEVKMGQLVDQLTNAESTMNLLTEMFTESQQTVAALTARVEALEGTQP
jgi:hypothetical protein